MELEKLSAQFSTGRQLADGSYSIRGIPAGIYTVTVWKEGYETVKQMEEARADEDIEYNFTLIPQREVPCESRGCEVQLRRYSGSEGCFGV